MKVFRSHLLICGGTGCQSSGSLAVKKALLEEIDKRKLTEEVKSCRNRMQWLLCFRPDHGSIP